MLFLFHTPPLCVVPSKRQVLSLAVCKLGGEKLQSRNVCYPNQTCFLLLLIKNYRVFESLYNLPELTHWCSDKAAVPPKSHPALGWMSLSGCLSS